MIPSPEVKWERTIDKFPEILMALSELDLNNVLVGIPAENAGRKADAKGRPVAINNAALGYIHEHGAPEANLPARPHLIPGVRKILPEAVSELRKATLRAIAGKKPNIEAVLNKIGAMARDSVKATMVAGLEPPLKPATIKARLRRRRSWSLAKRQKLYANLQPGDMRPLIDTAQLLNSYTYVLRIGRTGEKDK